MVSCMAYGCKSRGERKDPEITFHRFPKDLEIRKLWIKNMQLQGWKPTANSRVCSKHFEEKFFYKTDQKVKLLRQAVPTLFLQFCRDLRRKTKSQETDSETDAFPSTSEVDAEKRKMKNENTTQEENITSSQDDQLEFFTIIADDDCLVNFKEEENHDYKRSLSSPLDSIKVLKNSDNDSSSGESDEHNPTSVLSSEIDEDIKETYSNNKTKHINRPGFIGDCSSNDTNNPDKARDSWRIAKKTISDLKMKNRLLQRRNHRLTMKIQCLRSLFRYLEENNFLNQYANAVVKAVISEKPEPMSSS